MPRKQHNELKAGVFVMVALAVCMGIIIWLGASTMFHHVSQQAFFYMDASSGTPSLKVGNDVMINDKTIGRITDIRIDPYRNGTLYVADISEDNMPIYSNGSARPATNMLGQGALVVLSRGSKDKPLVNEKEPICIGAGLDQAMANIADASEQLKNIARAVQGQLNLSNSEALLTKLHGIVNHLTVAADNIVGASKNVNASAVDVKSITSTISTQLDAKNPVALLAKIHRSADDVNAITSDAKPKVSAALTSFQNTAQTLEGYTKKDLAETLANLRQVSTKVLKVADEFGDLGDQARQMVVLNRQGVDRMVENMTQVSDDLKATAKEVRRNPWRLFYKPDKQELKSQNIADAARAFSSGAGQLEEAIAKLNALAKASPQGIPANDPELAKIRKAIQETFGNFTKAEDSLWKELSK